MTYWQIVLLKFKDIQLEQTRTNSNLFLLFPLLENKFLIQIREFFSGNYVPTYCDDLLYLL